MILKMKKVFQTVAAVVFVVMLVSVTVFSKADVNVKKVSKVNFTDITDHWSRHYIDRLYTEGIVVGSDRLFKPEDNLTRAEALAMLLRSDNVGWSETKCSFSDVSENEWYYQTIAAGESYGIIPESMLENNRFLPNQAITRGEMASLTVSFMKYLGHEGQGKDDVEKMLSFGFYVDAPEPERTIKRSEICAVITRILDYENCRSFYVDNKEGNDENSGTIDAPFRTIERAQSAVRKINDNMTGNVYIYIKAGEYFREKPIELSAKDSGSNGYSVIYSSYGSGQAVIHGGKAITGWELFDAEKNIYRAKTEKGLSNRNFFVNGLKATRARSNGGLTDATFDYDGYTSADTFLADFKYPTDLEFVVLGYWNCNRFMTESITTDGKRVTINLTDLWTRYKNGVVVGGNLPNYYENALELLDECGEFYADKHEGYVYYKPRIGEDMESAEAYLAVKEFLLIAKGEHENKIKNVSFTDLSFAYTTWDSPDMMGGFWVNQANLFSAGSGRIEESKSAFPLAALEVEYADGFTFEKCKFFGLGATGVKMPHGIDNSAVVGNEFHSISGSALQLGDDTMTHRSAYENKDTRWYCVNNEISNNYIHDIAVDYMSGCGVVIGLPTNMTFRNNEIFSTAYSAMHVSIGWQGQYTSNYGDCEYINNYIHEINVSDLYDGGGFYSLGGPFNDDTDPLIIEGNYFRNKYNAGAPIYLDEGSANYLIQNNVVDVRDVSKVLGPGTVGDIQTWYNANEAQSGNNILKNNYTTIDFARTRYNALFENTMVYPDANWPHEARMIIKNAGISDEYKYLFPDDLQRYKVNLDKIVQLKTGEQFKIEISDCEIRKDVSVNKEDYDFVFSTNDENVVSVDENGVITALSQGQARVTVSVVTDGFVRSKSGIVYVDDIADSIKTKKNFYKLSVGEKGKLSSTVYTAISFTEVEGAEFTYVSENPEIVSVDNDGNVTANSLGTTSVLVSTIVDGKEVTQPVSITVEEGIEGAEEVNLTDLMLAKASWTEDGNMKAIYTQTADSMGIYTPQSSVYLKDKTYENAIFNFKVKFDFRGGSWPAFSMRAQSTNYLIGNANTSYLVIFKDEVIEVQRYTFGQRFVICGDIGGFVPLVSAAIPNEFAEHNTVHDMKIGAINVEEGVRLVCFIDGVKVFDVVDDTAGAVLEPGYFGVSDHINTLTFVK